MYNRALTCVLLCACSAPSDLEPVAETEAASSSWTCPPFPQMNPYPSVRIDGIVPKTFRPGDEIRFEGSGFDTIPLQARAWFYTDANGWTATSELHVVNDKLAIATVPTYHLETGPGWASMHIVDCFDCTASGGQPNECRGNWVTGDWQRFDLLPTLYPKQVGNLSATATSDTEILLTWMDVSNNESFFEICMGPDRNSTTNCLGTVAANSIGVPVQYLTPATDYCFEVRATNGHGYKPFSPLAKRCARTFERPRDSATVTVGNIPGEANSMCVGAATGPVYAFTDSNRDGIVDALKTGAFNASATHHQVPDIYANPPWHIYKSYRYEPGANVVVFTYFERCSGYPTFVAMHLNITGNRIEIVAVKAGNISARTGPVGEDHGVVLHGIDTAGPIRYDDATGRLEGDVTATVLFTLHLPDTNVTIDYAATVRFDFTRGVDVWRE